MNDDLDGRIRQFLSVLEDLAPPAPSVSALVGGNDEPERRSGTALPVFAGLAAASLIAVLLVWVNGHARHDPGLEPAAESTTSAATTPTDPRQSLVGWYLPSSVPQGYEIISVQAFAAKPPTEIVEQRWIGIGSSGTLSLMSFTPPTNAAEKPPSYNATVGGIDALVFDSGEGIVVSWQQGGRVLQVRGIGLSQDATLAAAQTVTVDTATGRARMNPGAAYSLVEGSAPVGNAVALGMDIVASDGDPQRVIHLSSSPNADLESLATLKKRVELAPKTTAAITAVAGIDRLVIHREGGVPQTSIEVAWIQSGFLQNVVGGATEEELLALAGSVGTVDVSAVVEEQQRASDRLHARPTLDAATFADGTSVSVKEFAGRVGGLCLEGQISVCRWNPADTRVDAAGRSGSFVVLPLGDRKVLVGWHEGPDAPSLTLPPGVFRDVPTASTATLTDVAATDAGRFVEIVVPPGEQPPAVSFAGQSALYTAVDAGLV